MEPNRVHHGGVYGLAVRLGLLSTPSLDDAVTSGYGQPVLCPKGTFTLLLVCAFRRTIAGFQPGSLLKDTRGSGAEDFYKRLLTQGYRAPLGLTRLPAAYLEQFRFNLAGSGDLSGRGTPLIATQG